MVSVERMGDPDSTVREAEFARLPQVLAATERLKLFAKGLVEGNQILTPGVVRSIVESADVIYNSAKESQRFREEETKQAVLDFNGTDRDVRRVIGRGFIDPKVEAARKKLGDVSRFGSKPGGGSNRKTDGRRTSGGRQTTDPVEAFFDRHPVEEFR